MIKEKTAYVSPQKYAQKVVLADVCRVYGLKQEWLALMLGKTQPTISNWLDAGKPDFPNFDDWTALMGLIKDHTGSIEPLRGICNWHGADAVSLSTDGISLDPKTLGRLASVIAKKEGLVLALLVQILEDGRIDADEEGQLHDAYPDIESLYLALGDLRERAKAAHHAQQRRPA